MVSSMSASSSFFLLATIISYTFLVHGVDAARDFKLVHGVDVDRDFQLDYLLSVTPSNCEKGPQIMYEACIQITNKDYTSAASSLLLVGIEMVVQVADECKNLKNKETSDSPLKKALAECQKIYVAAVDHILKIAKDLHDKKPLAQAQPSLASFLLAGITCGKEFRKANLKSPLTAANKKYTQFGEETRFILSLTPMEKQPFA